MEIKCCLKAGSGIFKGADIVYPSALDAGRISARKFVEGIEHNCQIGMAQTQAVLSAVASELQKYLELGHSVEIPGLGTFSLEIKGKVGETPTGAKTIENAKAVVGFLPKVDMRRSLQNAKCKIVSDKVARSRSLTEDESLEIAAKLLDENGYFVQRQFAGAAGVSQGYASKLLRQLEAKRLIGYNKSDRIKIYDTINK